MRKLFLFFIFFLATAFRVFSQDVYLKTGINSTIFIFEDKDGQPLYNFLPSVSPSFEVGYGFPISGFLVNEFGISLDGYSSKGDNPSRDHSWSTLFGGLRNTTTVSASLGDLEIGIFGTLGLSKILVGDQIINNGRYDLTKEEDFKGLFGQLGLGINLNYFFSNQVFLSTGIDQSLTSNLKKSDFEALRFSTTRILFGIHLILD